MMHAESMREHWDRLLTVEPWPNVYHGLSAEEGREMDESIRDSLAQIVPYITEGLRAGGRVLDLGCGPGRLTWAMARLCPQAEIIGLDVSPVAVQMASFDAPTNATHLIGDGHRVPYGLRPIDAAYSMLMFQHVDATTVRTYLDSLAAVMPVGAPFRFQYTTGEGEAAFLHNYTDDQMIEWARAAGFDWVTRGEPDPQFPTWRWLLLRREAGAST